MTVIRARSACDGVTHAARRRPVSRLRGDVTPRSISAGGFVTARRVAVHRTVTERAVKVAAILGLDKLKALGKTIHFYSPRLVICRRKLGGTNLAATRAPKSLNPLISGHS
jgi:hypothetical protein